VLRADHSSRGVLPMCASTACDRKGQPRPGKVSKRHKKKHCILGRRNKNWGFNVYIRAS